LSPTDFSYGDTAPTLKKWPSSLLSSSTILSLRFWKAGSLRALSSQRPLRRSSLESTSLHTKEMWV